MEPSGEENTNMEDDAVWSMARQVAETLARESPPAGIDPALLEEENTGEQPDLHALFSAMTVLSQEVKSQGRAFSGLKERVEGLTKSVEDSQERQADRGDHGMELFMEMADRLNRMAASIDGQIDTISRDKKPSLYSRFFKPGEDSEVTSAVKSLRSTLEGIHLMLSILSDKLRAAGITRLDPTGEIFNPSTMEAVDSDTTGSAPEGTVVDVYQAGYIRDGKLLRTARVKVSKSPDKG